jgi:16S rRNA (cytidine1402-2'-O)-methyltransferase
MSFEIENLKQRVELDPALYILPTPIGNLEDITFRAFRILNSIEIIACEDTRRIGTLLKSYNLESKKLISFHDYNEQDKSQYVINFILENKSVALVSDAGTPTISDPGYRLVQSAIKNNVKIISLPGATAFVPALVASGFPINEFKFVGFPPQKKGRKSFIENSIKDGITTIFYESTHRIIKFIEELEVYLGADKSICVAKEISKIYETYYRGTISEVKAQLNNKTSSKGEFVIII